MFRKLPKHVCKTQEGRALLKINFNTAFIQTVINIKTTQFRKLHILGDPGAVSGGRESLNGREKNSGEEKSRTRIS